MNIKALKEVEFLKSKKLSPAFFETVVEWINHGFTDHKDTTALVFGQQEFTYKELNSLSNKIANYLVRKGISRGDHVGICLKRSPEMIATLIGILKSGAAYVPLDANYPVDRLSMMSEDAQLSLLIIHKNFEDRFKSQVSHIVLWESINHEIKKESNVFVSPEIDGEDIAYVIFTSGSTGRPKGIEMPHRALSNLISWQLDRPYFKSEAKVLQYSSISFDVSFQEIATTFASGGTLVLVRDSERKDPRVLLNLLNNYKIERLFVPFVALRSLVEVANTTNKYPGSLTEVITAGEQLRVDNGLRTFFEKIDEAILENQYGPSETHVISAYLLDKDPSNWSGLPPIGKPIQNNSIHILDENLRSVPEGEEGELYLAGKNLAHGYIGREDLTQKVFIENSVEIFDYPVLYKTGDLGFYDKEGNIQFLGRADHQIKIRGYRVEPGEIDTIGASFPGVSQCITHVRQDSLGQHQLVTYYLSQPTGGISEEAFRSHLSDHLPEYMIPSFVIELKEIPYTPSGKVDVKSLPEPDIRLLESGEKVEYKSDTEARLAQIWSDVLGLKNIPSTANFFDIGGDSLKAVTLFMEIEEQFDVYLPLSELTQASTIEDLAKVVEEVTRLDHEQYSSLQLLKSGDPDQIPLFLIHGGEGNVLIFQDLVEKLPHGQLVYAFQWPGWTGFNGISSISEMAEHYTKELLEAHPEGPYRLGGYCIGGVIAIEIARLLKSKGAEVIDPILVVDAPNIHARSYHSNEPDSSAEGKEAFELLEKKLKAQIPVENESSSNNKLQNPNKSKLPTRRYPLLAKYLPFYLLLGKMYLRLLDKLQLMRIKLYPKINIKVPVQDRKLWCQLTQIGAVKKHKRFVYDGDILYLKSEALKGEFLSISGWWNDLFFGFDEVCKGDFEAYVIGGNHNDVLKKSYAHQIINEKMLRLNESF
jgi:amino acid adenylation domain-containing protein